MRLPPPTEMTPNPLSEIRLPPAWPMRLAVLAIAEYWAEVIAERIFATP
jgi:hypothetical protein